MPAKKTVSPKQALVKTEPINVAGQIYIIRDQRVMLDSDLATLYGITTFNMNKAVRRNLRRFPPDFMFQLSAEEYESLRFQIGISNEGRGGRRYMPYVFTEQGVAMLSSVLNSEWAIEVNIGIMRAFVKMRRMTASHKELAGKIEQLEKKYDKQFAVVFQAIKQLMELPTKPSRKIGFKS